MTEPPAPYTADNLPSAETTERIIRQTVSWMRDLQAIMSQRRLTEEWWKGVFLAALAEYKKGYLPE